MYRVCQKSDTLVNYINIMSYKLQNIRYLHCLNNFHICYYWFTQLCAQCVHPAAVQPKCVFHSVRWCTVLLQSPSVLTTLGSDVRQQSFTNNMFTVTRAAYFCSQFNENNASFAHTRDANRNHHVMHLTRVGNSNTKRVSLFLAHTVCICTTGVCLCLCRNSSVRDVYRNCHQRATSSECSFWCVYCKSCKVWYLPT